MRHIAKISSIIKTQKMIRIHETKKYIGKEADLPDTLPTGDTYISSDTENVYVYINKQPVSQTTALEDSTVNKRVGEFVFKKSGALITDGYLAVNPGIIVNGAIDYPIWASMYSEFIIEDDIFFPADVEGMFLRNIGGNSDSEGVFQESDNKEHSHNYIDTSHPNFRGQGSGSNVVRQGSVNSARVTEISGGTEARPINRAYQLYTIVDNY